MDPIEPKALHFIRTAKAQLPMDTQEFTGLMMERYGVSSPEALNCDQGDDFVAYLRTLGFGKRKRPWTCRLCAPQSEDRRQPAKDAGCLADFGQLLTIGEFQRAVKWAATGSFSSWLSRYFNIKEVTTSQQARAVMSGLRALLRNQKGKCRACPHRSNLKIAGVAGGEAPCRG